MRAKKDIPPESNQSLETWKRFENLRTNLRLLRALSGVSAETAGKAAGLEKHYRFFDLESGRGVPKLDEIEKLAKYFKTTIDDLLYKKARIIFE